MVWGWYKIEFGVFWEIFGFDWIVVCGLDVCGFDYFGFEFDCFGWLDIVCLDLCVLQCFVYLVSWLACALMLEGFGCY